MKQYTIEELKNFAFEFINELKKYDLNIEWSSEIDRGDPYISIRFLELSIFETLNAKVMFVNSLIPHTGLQIVITYHKDMRYEWQDSMHYNASTVQDAVLFILGKEYLLK